MDKLIEAALALDDVSINYLVEMSPTEAREFLSHAQAYNSFTQEDLLNLVEAVDREVPPMRFGPDNPNTGKVHHVYLVGNEGSRVLYLALRKFYLEECFQGKPYDYQLLTLKLGALAAGAYADECSVTQDDKDTFRYRFWWD